MINEKTYQIYHGSHPWIRIWIHRFIQKLFPDHWFDLGLGTINSTICIGSWIYIQSWFSLLKFWIDLVCFTLYFGGVCGVWLGLRCVCLNGWGWLGWVVTCRNMISLYGRFGHLSTYMIRRLYTVDLTIQNYQNF